MSSGSVSINKESGITMNVVHKNSDGTRIDITGYIFELYVKRNDTTDDEVISKTITSHTNAAQGETQIPITIADVENLKGMYFYWITVKESADTIPRTSQRGMRI